MKKKTIKTNQNHPAIVEYRKAMEKGKEKIKLYNIKVFKEALYGEDLTKLTKFLNEDIKTDIKTPKTDIKTSKEKLNELYLNEWIDEPK